jgi:hypothetical protein
VADMIRALTGWSTQYLSLKAATLCRLQLVSPYHLSFSDFAALCISHYFLFFIFLFFSDQEKLQRQNLVHWSYIASLYPPENIKYKIFIKS